MGKILGGGGGTTTATQQARPLEPEEKELLKEQTRFQKLVTYFLPTQQDAEKSFFDFMEIQQANQEAIFRSAAKLRGDRPEPTNAELGIGPEPTRDPALQRERDRLQAQLDRELGVSGTEQTGDLSKKDQERIDQLKVVRRQVEADTASEDEGSGTRVQRLKEIDDEIAEIRGATRITGESETATALRDQIFELDDQLFDEQTSFEDELAAFEEAKVAARAEFDANLPRDEDGNLIPPEGSLEAQFKKLEGDIPSVEEQDQLVEDIRTEAFNVGKQQLLNAQEDIFEQLNQEFAPSRGLRGGNVRTGEAADSPIIDRGGLVARETIRQTGQLSGQLAQAAAQFKINLRNQNFANRLQLKSLSTGRALELTGLNPSIQPSGQPAIQGSFQTGSSALSSLLGRPTNTTTTTSTGGSNLGGIGSILTGIGTIGSGFRGI